MVVGAAAEVSVATTTVKMRRDGVADGHGNVEVGGDGGGRGGGSYTLLVLSCNISEENDRRGLDQLARTMSSLSPLPVE
ncbi:unnamed protein product [Prunus armeniaca]|uniref:Uncharacterized protein n=1 Tax=Prunus armeniaca TaxID=36596 RepID=A0A6J5VKA9_PRUAR|nr:unnamed protein product [Prunus armeniaca]